jgi:hypothetical protein
MVRRPGLRQVAQGNGVRENLGCFPGGQVLLDRGQAGR